MRFLVIALILLSLAFAQEDPEIKRAINLTAEASCPDDSLEVTLTSSDGKPVPDIELRLVLYVPYQGLRALQHTDEQGKAWFELSKNGSYRIYISTEDYEHPRFVEFEYPVLCPPPPPKEFIVTATPVCADSLISVTATHGGEPLEGVSVRTEKWSSLTSANGTAVFPLEEGDIYIIAEKTGFSKKEFWAEISCAPPPECNENEDCESDEYCKAGACEKIPVECGYAENHTLFMYECCSDDACGIGSACKNNTCIKIPKPPEPPQNASENESQNETGAPPSEPAPLCPAGVIFFVLVALCARR
ncbi:MAG: hypothetical protein AB1324_06450 [Candidatus Micrarchaeota archaeon]